MQPAQSALTANNSTTENHSVAAIHADGIGDDASSLSNTENDNARSNLSTASTYPTCLQKLFSSTAATGNPRSIGRKVMMTMASLTADNTPPWPHNNIICTATPSKPLRESIALKDGTRGIDSTRYKHQTAL